MTRGSRSSKTDAVVDDRLDTRPEEVTGSRWVGAVSGSALPTTFRTRMRVVATASG
jgi:hypothetical protein